MANPSFSLIESLRETANRLRNGAQYSWGHHGACNCGNLAQVITSFTGGEILRYAHTGNGEWTELAEAYCPASNAPVDLVMKKLMDAGLTPGDIRHLEYLTDREVLNCLPGGFRWLKKNQREDAILYLEAFACLLEGQLKSKVNRKKLQMPRREVAEPELILL